MINDILKDAENRMSKTLEVLADDLAKIRTGRAHPDILAHVTIDYYGSATPITQVANVTVLDARTLGITPWEKGLAGKIEKAIITSDLGLNPTNLGDSLRVPMPALNEERRKELVKLVKSETESGRVSIRNIRRDANGDIKELLKEKEITEDEAKRAEDNIQKITDKMIAQADALAVKKEQDLMVV
ncbi:ribosome recycling factor [Francisella philomiragia]|uniref:Ribosome-recycling factor n=2 Tax=Francisella philomiragia TaxID=28110 RepID=RRF_FRAP2|nr:ribosome recycling factor [Francisella philomiragia]B0U0Z8.1 RecName: Full=Ribosome-recycling factor; Short=RRF; AltName: Full=Ribosome-releasing factor [Francisella philomiragia subsp. philomiragia ATCC 25017]AJI47458.1 ribosome recycling factor [Francisella philomiragia]AJI50120.1 ribosome recycling factor [Francisella philomiragia]AJI55581.1 ribosome recycling factor [Francisella philomiragia]AJI56891.1 ribosome recycling factor [Francisella philomiragia]AJI75477.1 ribosome recycling fa